MLAHPASPLTEPVEAGRLDLHEGIPHPEEAPGCKRWPAELRLRSSRGQFVRGRCKSGNLCDHCARVAAIEAAEMVALDATAEAPTTFVVLTTRDPHVPLPVVRDHLRLLTRAARRRWPTFRYACFAEFTTGLSVWSGGHRRIHLNLLVKGVPDGDRQELERVARATWGERTGTTQLHVGPVYAAEGLTKYVTNLALHVAKSAQAPPKGWRGHRITWTRNYFADGRSAAQARADARASLQAKRDVWRARQRLGDAAPAELVELEAATIAADRESTTWELVEVVTHGHVIEPRRVLDRSSSQGVNGAKSPAEGNDRERDHHQGSPPLVGTCALGRPH